jgi:hypothetical protein
MAKKSKKSGKIGWRRFQRLYVGRKYRGRVEGIQITLTVVDVTLGGDPVIRRRGYGDTRWDQSFFEEFASRAKEIK